MTSRTTLLIDRAATLVLAVLLIAGGVTALWWSSGQTVHGITLAPTSDTSPIQDVVAAAWFPWAGAAAGLFLAVIGIRWIAAHLTSTAVKQLRLAGSGTTGRLDVAGPKIARAAADALADTIGVRSASGAVIRDRGQLVARLEAIIEPSADLTLIAARADQVSAQLATALGRDDLSCTVRLRVAARGRTLPRTS